MKKIKYCKKKIIVNRDLRTNKTKLNYTEKQQLTQYTTLIAVIKNLNKISKKKTRRITNIS